MIIFYEKKQPKVIKLSADLQSKFEQLDCTTPYGKKSQKSPSLKPKTKCCEKFKKKGINCKRCPHTFLALG